MINVSFCYVLCLARGRILSTRIWGRALADLLINLLPCQDMAKEYVSSLNVGGLCLADRCYMRFLAAPYANTSPV